MEDASIEIGHNLANGFEVDQRISPSERGYQFQFQLVERLFDRLTGFSTITMYDMNRNIITRDTLRKRGRDGGLDVLIRIETKTPLASRQVAGKVWKILEGL
jgi:hypothetical protein